MRRSLANLTPALLALLALATAALAQDVVIEPQTGDVSIALVNGTTGAPGAADRLELRQIGYAMKLLAAADGVSDKVVFPAVEMLPFRPYLAIATRGGVAYRAQMTGQEFLDGKTLTVHVFDETDDTAGVTVTGMNVVARRHADGCELEYILTIENESRPQRTIAAASSPLRFAAPALTSATAELYRGPQPEDAEVTAADGLTAARIPLAPGTTRFVHKGFLAESGPVHLEIGANLPVAAWSLMVSPAELAVDARDLTRDEGDYPGFGRWRGPALTAGQRVPVDLPALSRELAAAATHAKRAAPTDGASRAAATGNEAPGRSWIWIVGAAISLGLLAIGLWRRSGR